METNKEKQPARTAIEELVKLVTTAEDPGVRLQAATLILNHATATERLALDIRIVEQQYK